ncbi:hypothetical protein CIPAW_05G217300 [Carya illinoinensis]|uniref:Uncharacterized protein n=1 Tax=Carya illinoinensis TaxID=32201 RepID=A0A8T1QMG7_CARIL|nr:hypothetical protein CIPAW_05G217300 [Carya illinoinensis]
MAVGGGFYGVWHWVLAGLWWIAFPEVVRKCGCVARSPCVRTGHGGGHDPRVIEGRAAFSGFEVKKKGGCT